MPNLAGIFDRRQEPTDILGTLEKYSAVLSVHGLDYNRKQWADNRFGTVNLLNDLASCPTQPATTADGRRVLFLDGAVYNLDHLARMGKIHTDSQCRATP